MRAARCARVGSVTGCEWLGGGALGIDSGGETPPELAGEDACGTGGLRRGECEGLQPTRAGLRFEALGGKANPMTATITIDDGGQINLPEALKVVFGVKPGVRLRADVTADRIEIVKDIPVVTEGVFENGVLVLPRLGIPMDAAAAVRADRDEQAERALRR